MAYNALNDNTKSYLQNTDTAPGNVNVNANSSSKVYAVGAGVAVSGTENALNRSVAVNHGSNSTQAVLDNVKSNAVNNLNVNATDSVKKVAVGGGLTLAGGSVAVGGSVAYNDVGSSDNQQLTKVTLKGNDITATGNVSVNAKDTSDLLTVGVGIGGSGKVAVQGSAAVATLNKDVGISLDNSSINANNVSFKANTAQDLITTADVLSIGGNVGIGAGVSVNNDYTKTGVASSNSSLSANILNADSQNSSKVLTIGGAAGGTAGVTGSVAVNNLNTNTANNFVNATVFANNGVLINAKGDESIANYAGTISASGSGAAVGLSVSVNNINSNVNNIVGKELDSSYESDTNKDRTEKDGSQANVNEHINKANEAGVNKLAKGDNLKSGGMNIELVSNADKKVTAGGSQNSGTHITISGNLTADTISVNNLGTNNMTQGLFTGSAGGVSANGAVGILNFKRNASTNITGDITANDLTINNQDLGESEQEILQGGFGLGAAVNASYGRLNVTGKNNIKIEGNTLDATTLNISNSDNSRVNVESKGVSASLGRATGVLIAEGSLDSSNEIEINNATLTGKTISISGTASPEVSVDGLAASASATFAGSGLFAGSINNSAAKIFGDGATFTSENLTINADNLSKVKTSTNSVSGSLLASGSLTGILNKSNAAATVDFKNANINAPKTSVNAKSLPNQKVGLVSLGAGGLMAATGSVAAVTSNPSATANISAKEITADDLKMNVTADSTPDISVKGYSVGAIAVGSNLIASTRDVKVDASLKADSATLNNLDINAKNVSAPNLNVNGDGGGLVGIAPAAAVLNDNLTQSATVKLGGTLNVKNTVNVNAQNSDAGKYTADALGAAVVGASGVNLNRNAESKAVINFDAAKIKSSGTQTYTATNDLGNKLDLEAAGYGGLNASAGQLTDKTKYTANINVNDSNLTTDAGLNMNTQTTGKAESLNNGIGRSRTGHKLFRRRNDLRQSNQRQLVDAKRQQRQPAATMYAAYRAK